MKRARALSVRRETESSNSIGKARKRSALLAVAAMSGVAMMGAGKASAATLTWTGTVVDPSSGGGAGSYTANPAPSPTMIDPLPANPYRWTNDATNWSGGTYAVGTDVVFTDNFTGGTAVRLSTSGLNPKSMTF